VLDISVAALFHAGKRAETAAGRTPSPRFLQAGRWRVSRHPNFFIGSAIGPWFPRGTRAPLRARTA
jgi:hypothetical protein